MRIWMFLILFFSQTLFAAKAGDVIAAQGTVVAVKGGSERALSRGSSVFVEETIQVGPASRCQIRLTDQSVLTLIPDTEYTIDSYSFRNEKGHFSSQLLKGGMRMISGEIEKSDPKDVLIKTPSATMGLRGTIFSIRVVGQGVYFGCESGCIDIRNQAGRLELCPKLKSQFAFVPSPDQVPQPLSARPNPLNLKNFAPPKAASCP